MKHGFLEVGGGHTLYYEEYGCPEGIPAVVLHGGPGGGMTHGSLKCFDLKHWRVILYDQRGCGKSTPFGSIQHNTTKDLVEDIERLRKHHDVSSWYVLGGSWGTTLGLMYAVTYPSSVCALLLRGVCLMSKWEMEWLYMEGGASQIFPEEWATFVQKQGPTRRNVLTYYSKKLSHPNRHTRRAAARRWWGWEASLSYLKPRSDTTDIQTVESLARLETHYFSHNAWIHPARFMRKIRQLRMPITIVQGRYDMVCPMRAAWELKQAVPHAKLHIVPDAGHSGSEPGTAKALRQATDLFLHEKNRCI
jgi:proline iminopeptidase